MQPNVKIKKAWMYVNDILLKYCKFYTGHSVEHRVESIQIFIKATWFITSCQSQSETENKAWTSTVLNFVSYLAQTCVGSSQRSYVNSIHLLVQLLQAGYFHTWPWLDETVFLKACAWFDLIIQGIEILIVNTSTTYHKDEWLRHTHAMHDTCNYEIDMRRLTNHPFLVNTALGTMLTWFSIIFQKKWVYNPIMVCL